MKSFFTLFFCIYCCSKNALADVPISLENIIARKDNLKLDYGFSYVNTYTNTTNIIGSIPLQTGTNSFINIPITEKQFNIRDTATMSIGLRYGIGKNTEIYSRSTYVSDESRIETNTRDFEKNSNHQWSDHWIGINHQLKQEDDYPAILNFLELAVDEKNVLNPSQHDYLKSFSIGTTLYKSVDPVVFSFTFVNRFNKKRNFSANDNYQPGNMMMISPSIAFAVNDHVSLTTAFQWINQKPFQINGENQSLRKNQLDLLLGVGYVMSDKNSLNATIKPNGTDQQGANFRFNWIRNF
jgi:hypothetical protein